VVRKKNWQHIFLKSLGVACSENVITLLVIRAAYALYIYHHTNTQPNEDTHRTGKVWIHSQLGIHILQRKRTECEQWVYTPKWGYTTNWWYAAKKRIHSQMRIHTVQEKCGYTVNWGYTDYRGNARECEQWVYTPKWEYTTNWWYAAKKQYLMLTDTCLSWKSHWCCCSQCVSWVGI